MAEDLWHFPISVPAGITKAAPQVTLTQFPAAVVESVRWRFPPGCNGLVGIRISMRDVAVIPANDTQWIVDSAASGTWPLSGFPDTGDWSVTAYNTGGFPHTVEVTYLVKYRQPPPRKLELAPLEELHEWPAGDAAIYVPGMWG